MDPDWQQGDYSLSMTSFPVVDSLDDGELILGGDPVVGVAVVTQTCDIVNTMPGKEHVVICPLVELSLATIEGIRKGRSLAAAALELPPTSNIVVDIGRMATLHKSALDKLKRCVGFSSDEGRVQFAEALERKFGRFAFPDEFNNSVLSKLRDRILGAHGKAASDHGKSYRSIRTSRVTATPSWGLQGDKSVVFHFVLEREALREATREAIEKTLDEHLGKLIWPQGFVPGCPLYHLVTPEEMLVVEWLRSQPIDWEFISIAGKTTT